MPLIHIEGEIPSTLQGFDAYQTYNVLDSAITAQLLPVISSRLANTHAATYAWEMELQSLCLEMSSRGFPIDEWGLVELIHSLRRDAAKATAILHRFCAAVDFPPLNPNSPLQIQQLFYEHLRLPTQYEFDRKKGVRKISTDRKALEKLSELYPIASPFVNAIDAAKGAMKLAAVFSRGLEPGTNRLRCNVTPSGTETGRLSSQQNPYGRGTNAQNLTDRARTVVVAPAGRCLVNIDLKTAESIAVGYLSRDRNYIDACLSGDVHTAGCRLVWPDMAWTGDIRQDKTLAGANAYRIFSYRDLMKKGGHATNYYGKPRTLQKVAFLGQATIAFVEEFQRKYFTAFPGIEDWHLRTIAELQTTGVITTPLGRERRFWGRTDDAATHREAIAYAPQSLVADVWNRCLVKLQRWLIAKGLSAEVHLLMQVHDSVLIELPTALVHELVPQFREILRWPVDFGDLGAMVIPTDFTIGQSWAKEYNHPRGQRDYSPSDDLTWLT